MLNVLKNIKYKVISAVIGISIIGSTWIASVVHASPINTNSTNTKSEVLCYNSYSYTRFTNHIDALVTEGAINDYQKSEVLYAYGDGADFQDELDNLVSEGIINSYQESRILSYSSSSDNHKFGSRYLPPVQNDAPTQSVAVAQNRVPLKNSIPSKNVAPAQNVIPEATAR